MAWSRWLRLIGLVGLVVAVYFLVPIGHGELGGPVLRGILAGLGLLMFVGGLLRQLRLAALGDDRRVDGLVVAIVVVVAVFAMAFYALEVNRPGELEGLSTRLDALYFSATTVMTVGYGDIHAAGQAARGIVLVQMVFNTAFVATAAGLLTSRIRSAAAARRSGLTPPAG